MYLKNILARFLETKQAALTHLQARPLEELRAAALAARKNAPRHALRTAIAQPDRLNFIAEIKRGSQLQGWIQAEFNPAKLALEYSKCGQQRFQL
jgi:indole-3-glycerol phosphate synthase